MYFKIKIISKGERLTIVCEEESQRSVLVRGHFRVIKGKRTYVKAHRRRRR